MAEPKTIPTDASAAEFLDAVPDPKRRADAIEACALIGEATGAPPVMWGDSIIGFGTYSYKYATGKEGVWPAVGLSPRKASLVLYLGVGFEGADDLLARLGPHKMGQSCLHMKRLGDVDRDVLRELVTAAHRDLDGRTLTSQ